MGQAQQQHSADSLGQFLFQIRGSRKTAIVLMILAPLLVLWAAGIGALVPEKDMHAAAPVFGAIIGVPLFIIGLITCLTTDCDVHRVFERGVLIDRIHGTEQFLFEFATAVTLGAVRINGASANVAVRLQFASGEKIRLRGVRSRRGGPEADHAHQLYDLAMLTSEFVAQRIVQDVQQGIEVPWVHGMTFCSAGIRNRSRLVPWTEIEPPTLGNGFYRLETTSGQFIGAGQAAARNVYPGFKVLERMRQQTGEETPKPRYMF